jgi:hypothetical protein
MLVACGIAVFIKVVRHFVIHELLQLLGVVESMLCESAVPAYPTKIVVL